MNVPKPLAVLLLCDYDPFGARMIQDSIHALARKSRHEVRCLSFRGDLPENMDLSRFDAIAIHYSSFIYSDRYVSPDARRRIAAFAGTKVVFLHDEYKHVNLTKSVLAELGVSGLFTCFDAREAERVYGDLCAHGMRSFSVLPGYVPQELLALGRGPACGSRPIDIGYRGRMYPPWHGTLGQDRVRIHKRVKADAPGFGLVVDSSVAERDRLYGKKWLAFQRRCKTVLGTESGASVVDFTGQVARDVEAHLAQAPETPFEELRSLYFADLDESIRLRTLSPRIFEAIACGCGLILYEGAYAGRLKVGRHYLPLAHDHANFGELVKALREPGRIDALVETARVEVLLAPENQEEHFVGHVDDVLIRLQGQGKAIGYEQREFIRRFGRYDFGLTKPLLKRQLFRIARSAYMMGTRALPMSVERKLTRAVRGALFDVLP